MSFIAGRSSRGPAFFATFVACVAIAAAATPSESPSTDDVSPFSDGPPPSETTAVTAAGHSAVDHRWPLPADVAEDKGHHGPKPTKQKKKKPMGKHKKKKQTFKDKLLPLLLIPFVIQTMLIPMFIMNLKMMALKAMTIGKVAILLIVFNMIRSWSQNAHSTTIGGSTAGLMAQNYGFNGGPEFGSIFNGR